MVVITKLDAEIRRSLLPNFLRGITWVWFYVLLARQDRTREGQVRAMAGISTLTQSPLSASDRCDRCGAQAYVRVTLATGELLFCGHHSKEYAVSLKRVAVEIEDQTDRLLESNSER